MELLSKGTSHKNNSTTEQKDKPAKPQIATKAPQIATGKTEPQKPKSELPKPEIQLQPKEPVKPEQPKPSMNLDEKLKVVNELYHPRDRGTEAWKMCTHDMFCWKLSIYRV